VRTVAPSTEEIEELRRKHGRFHERRVDFTTEASRTRRSVAIERPTMRGAVLLVPVDIYRQAYVVREAENEDFFFPGGGIEPGETVEEAAIRELAEETGLEAENSTLKALWWWTSESLDGPTTVAHFVFLQTVVGDPEIRDTKEIAEVKTIRGTPPAGRFRQLVMDALSDTGMIHQWELDFDHELRFGTG
jgi:8-oxo-dGTP pyrophosphatase MutT (NUDIX family)